jgi:hypothetical protein
MKERIRSAREDAVGQAGFMKVGWIGLPSCSCFHITELTFLSIICQRFLVSGDDHELLRLSNESFFILFLLSIPR